MSTDLVNFFLNNEPNGKYELYFELIKKGEVEKLQNLFEEEENFDINKTNKNNETGLHVAIKSNQLEICKLLVQNQIKINAKELETGKTPLIIACELKNIQIVEYLLEQFPNPYETDKEGWNCLHWAVQSNSPQIVEILIKKYYDLSGKANKQGLLPIHIGVLSSSLESIEKLIQKTNHEISFTTNKEGLLPIHLATRMGNMNVLKIFIRNQVNLHLLSKEKRNVIHYVSEKGHVQLAEFLIKEGIDCNLQDSNGVTPLSLAQVNNKTEIIALLNQEGVRSEIHDFVKDGNIQEVQKLLQKNIDINALDADGNRPLHLAVISENKQMIDFLISSDANIDCLNSKNETPLHIAIQIGNVEIVQFLLSKGSDKNLGDFQGNHALHLSILFNQPEITKFFLELGADPNAPNLQGISALHLAAQEGNFELFQLLCNFQGNPNVVNLESKTPLHSAVERCQMEFIDSLLSSDLAKQMQFSHQDHLGRTPLMYAIKLNDIRLVSLLLSKEDKINLMDNNRESVLHYTIKSENSAILEMILKKKIRLRSTTGKLSPIHLAVKYNQKLDCFQMLYKHGAKINLKDKFGNQPIHLAALEGKFKFLALIEKWKGNKEAINNEKQTPLHLSAMNGHHELVKFLLVKDAKPNPRDKLNRTPLHLACEKGSYESAEILINYKAEVDPKDINGKTPLIIAIENKHFEIAELLVKHDAFCPLTKSIIEGNQELFQQSLNLGFPIDFKDSQGNTPLNNAILKGNVDLAKFILEHNPKPNINIIDSSGNTAIQAAALSGNVEICKILLKTGADLINYPDETKRPHMMAKNNNFLDCFNLLNEEFKRASSILEITETEENYVNDLNMLVEYVISPLKKNMILKKEEIEMIFSNINEIRNLNMKILFNLEHMRKNWNSESGIGEVLLGFVSNLKIYIQYNNNFNISRKAITKCMKNNSFATIVKKIEDDPKFHRLDLHSILIKPVQRITQYPLLLEEVVKRTPKEHPDYEKVSLAFQKFKKIAEEVNESKRQQEEQIKFEDIQKRLKGIQLTLESNPSRKYKLEGKLYVYSHLFAFQQEEKKNKLNLISKLSPKVRRETEKEIKPRSIIPPSRSVFIPNTKRNIDLTEPEVNQNSKLTRLKEIPKPKLKNEIKNENQNQK